ncbi:FMRFamide receptor-like [Lingula anatina]|uniref:FMRFamide receptor-like n=1 Tax=Lingula anatina TaxID=7574 RepID=A0A1S3JTT3_LINAN|nr:FMRFamide receptor-like [Lingula anatina]|eukprot:XP_013413757.1 FMRFamide receptor-like [Lingula anatina]
MNGTTQNCSRVEEITVYTFVIHVCLIGSLCTLGLIGNTLSLIVFFRYKARSVTFYLLRPVAIADNVLLLMTIAMMVLPAVYPALGVMELPNREEARITTWAWPLGMTAQTVSIWSLILVALDRYMSVCKPFKAESFRNLKGARIGISVVIIFSVLYNAPRLLEMRPEEMIDACTNTTRYYLENVLLAFPAYRIGYFIVSYTVINIIIPLFVLSYMNVHLIRELRKSRKARCRLRFMSPSLQKEDDLMTKLSILIVIVFIACQAPSLLTQILNVSEDYLDDQTLLFRQYYVPFSNALVVLNSSLNFVIYCVFCSGFRRALIGMFLHKSLEQSNCDSNKYSSVVEETNV